MAKRFSLDEIAYLQEAIVRRAGVIENKKTDGTSLHAKKKAWAEVLVEFNSIPEHSEKSLSQLQKCWDNMKTKKKKQLAQSKKNRMMTGGGSYRSPPHEEGDAAVEAVLVHTTDVELNCAVDSDTVALASQGNCEFYTLDSGVGLLSSLNDSCDLDETIGPEEPPAAQAPALDLETNGREPRSRETGKRSRKEKAVDVAAAIAKERGEALMRQDEELHLLKVKEQEIKIQIAKEDLKRKEIETEATRRRMLLWEEQQKILFDLVLEIKKKEL